MKEKSVLTQIVAWLRARREQRMARKSARYSEELKRESERVLQVREFDGQLFVCYNEVPLLTTCMLKEGLPIVVEAARMMYVEYYKTKGLCHRK